MSDDPRGTDRVQEQINEQAAAREEELAAAQSEEARQYIKSRHQLEDLNSEQFAQLAELGIMVPPMLLDQAPFVVLIDTLIGKEGSVAREKYKLDVEQHLQDNVFGHAYEHRNEIVEQIRAQQRTNSLVIPGRQG